jgi:pterin-4a-carbinolamine dehydratase
MRRRSQRDESIAMSAPSSVPEGWTAVLRPPSLFRRFEFGSYAQTRAFLDRLAALSERTGLYPDLSFGTKHVNVTIRGPEGGATAEAEQAFAQQAAALAAQQP